MGTRLVSLIRHGEYEPSPDGGVLTARGRRQATSTGKRLARLAPNAIYASTLSRAKESADLISAKVELPVRKPKNYLRESWPTGVKGYNVPLAARRLGRRRVEEICERHLRVAKRDFHEVLVCHGNIIRAVVAMALGMRLTAWAQMYINHGSFTQLIVTDSGRTALRHYNDVGHFTPGLISDALVKTKPR